MNDLTEQFVAAQALIKTVTERPDNATLLNLYVAFKQATEGDATGERPRMSDFVARAKYDAWLDVAGTPKEVAMQNYIDLVHNHMSNV